MLGSLRDDVADRVEPGAARAPGDLVELAAAQQALAAPVELAQRGEQHRVDRHVDADAEGVGAADHLEQAALGELFDETAVLRQHAGVVDADPVAQHPRQGGAEAGREPEVADGLDDLVALLGAHETDAHERLGLLGGEPLARMDDVDRRLARLDELADRLVQGRERPVVGERHRALGVGDDRGAPTGPGGQPPRQLGDVAERGAHDDEPAVAQLGQPHLPGPAAVGVGDEVELVHDDQVDVGRRALAQRDVGQDLGGAADDRGLGVHRGVAGDHADQVGAEDLAEREELLVDEGLDGGGVVAAAAGGQRDEVRRRGDERLARAGRRRDDRVVPGEQRQERLALVGVHRQPLARHPAVEGVEQRVGVVGERPGGQHVGQCPDHRGQSRGVRPGIPVGSVGRPGGSSRGRVGVVVHRPSFPSLFGSHLASVLTPGICPGREHTGEVGAHM